MQHYGLGQRMPRMSGYDDDSISTVWELLSADHVQSQMATHKYIEAGYHEGYSDEETEDKTTGSLDGDAARNPKVSPRRDAEVRPSHGLDEAPGPSNSSRADSQVNAKIQSQTEVSYRSTNLTKSALEPSWINAEPFDEFVREISDFIIGATRGRTNVEVSSSLYLAR